MKRIIMILLALAMIASFVACNEGGEVTTEAPETTAAPTETEALDAETTAEETEAAFNGYKVTVTDKDGNPIAGVQIQMCDSKGCRMPQGTGADGTVTFDTFDARDLRWQKPPRPAGEKKGKASKETAKTEG